MKTSPTNAHTVRGRPSPKKEIRRFQNGLVCELKVNERKLLRQSKTFLICSNRRNMLSERQDYTSCKEKCLAKEICIRFKSEQISTIGDDCSKSNSKEKEVRSFALRVGETIRKAIYRLSTRGSKTQSGPWSRNRL